MKKQSKNSLLFMRFDNHALLVGVVGSFALAAFSLIYSMNNDTNIKLAQMEANSRKSYKVLGASTVNKEKEACAALKLQLCKFAQDQSCKNVNLVCSKLGY